MGIVISILIGAACGVLQFFMMRYSLKPLSEGKDPRMVKVMLLKLPIPIALLVSCAIINIELLPFAGGAFCLSSVLSGVANHMMTLKRGEDI